MSFDNTKYHCEINSVPYQIRGYQKSELSTFIPRLGSGDQEESQFDLLRSRTLDGFDSGMLEREWSDDGGMYAIEGLFPKFDDGILYPNNSAVYSTSNRPLGSSKASLTASVVTDDYAFVAGRTLGGTNFVKRINEDGTVTDITVPADLSGGAGAITSMVIWNGQVWVFSASISSAVWYMAVTATTLTSITGGSGYVTNAVVFRGQLYGSSGSFANRILYRYTGSTSTRAWEQVGNTGQSDIDYTSNLFVYNNRIILTRADGMYAYDGIQMVAIEDSSQSINVKNYRFPAILRGYLYYFMPDGWYRFNGSLIEKLYDESEIGFPVDVCTGKNRIWFAYVNSSVLGSSRYDKAMGYDFTSTTDLNGRITVFNGKGLFTYARPATTQKDVGLDDVTDQGRLDKLVWFKDTLFAFLYFERIDGNGYYTVDTDELSASGAKDWTMMTSIFDGVFPMVLKSLENLHFVFDGDVAASDSITIQYRTSGFGYSAGWTTFGTLTTYSQPDLIEHIFRYLPDGITFKKIQLRISGTTNASYGISKFVLRYLLQPDYKNQWQFTVLCYGDNNLAPLLLADNTESSQSVGLLRGNIYDARAADVPINFVDIDQLDLNEELTVSDATVTLNSTNLLKGDGGFIQIDDEIMYWYAKTATTVEVLRGMLDTTAAVHTTGAKVFLVFRVIIRNIANEHIELTDPTDDIVSDTGRPSEITLTLQEV